MAGGEIERGARGAQRGVHADHRRGHGRSLAAFGRGEEQQNRGRQDRDRGRARGHAGRGGPPLAGAREPPPAGFRAGDAPPGRGRAVDRGRSNKLAPGAAARNGAADSREASGAATNDVEMAQEVRDRGKEVNEELGKKRRRKDPSLQLECAICTEEHFTNKCPLLRGPKPTVALCGAAEDGMGFFQIQVAKNNHIVDTIRSAAAALITVQAGEVSPQLLQGELARIIPVRWEWEVQ